MDIPQEKTKLFRKKLVHTLLLTLAILSIPIGFMSVYRVSLFGWKPLFIFQIIIAVFINALYAFRKRLDYQTHGIILIVIVFSLGVFALITWGIMGLGVFFLLLDILLTSNLFGFRHAYYLLILEAIVFVFIALCVQWKWLQFHFNFEVYAYSGFNWFNTMAIFVAFSAVLMAVTRSVYKNLEDINTALSRSEERYNLALESVNDALYDYLVENDELYLSPRYYTMLGYEVTLFEKGFERWRNLVHPMDMAHFEQKLIEHFMGKTAYYMAEYRMLNAQGNWQWILDRGRVTERDKNNHPMRMVGTHTDISSQKNALNQLQRTNTLLEHAQKIAQTGHYRYDMSSRALTWSKELYAIYKRKQESGPPSDKESRNMMAEGEWERLKKLQRKAYRAGKQLMTEYSILWPDESKRNILLVVDWEKDENGKTIAQIGTVQDITERKQLEKRIFDVIIETEEKERNSLAGTLHDDVGPLLSSMNMYLSMVSHPNCKNPEELHATMDKILQDTIVTVREISNNLSPHLLSAYGLYAALKEFIESKKHLILFEFNSGISNDRFDFKIEATYFRIIKELINNTLKYAQATHILITLLHKNNTLILTYKDDGFGCNIDEIMNNGHKGIGLLNIISRVKAINGIHKIESKAGEGFLFELFTNT